MRFFLVPTLVLILAYSPSAKAQSVFSCNGQDQTQEFANLLSHDGVYSFRGKCVSGSVSVENKTLSIDFDTGATLSPAEGNKLLWQFTDSNVKFGHIEIDGRRHGERIFNIIRGTFAADDIIMHDVGSASEYADNAIIGISLNAVESVRINKAIFRDFRSLAPDGTNISGGVGSIRGIFILKSGPVDIGTFEMSGGQSRAEATDFFHANTENVGGTVHHFICRYNGDTRRCFKAQSGNWTIEDAQISKNLDFQPVSEQTEAGLSNMNAIDWASSIDGGSIDILKGDLDLSGFFVGIANSGGGKSPVRLHSGVVVKGPVLNVIRHNPAAITVGSIGPAQNQGSIGFYTNAQDVGSGMDGATFMNWSVAALVPGTKSYVRNTKFIDPVDTAISLRPSLPTLDHDISNNVIITKTPGHLKGPGVILVGDVGNLTLNNNTLVEDGNADHTKTFINIIGAQAVGSVIGNKVPAGTRAVNAARAPQIETAP